MSPQREADIQEINLLAEAAKTDSSALESLRIKSLALVKDRDEWRRAHSDTQHSSRVVHEALNGVVAGAITLKSLRDWIEGPRTKGDGLYSWREDRAELLARIKTLEEGK